MPRGGDDAEEEGEAVGSVRLGGGRRSREGSWFCRGGGHFRRVEETAWVWVGEWRGAGAQPWGPVRSEVSPGSEGRGEGPEAARLSLTKL